MNQSIILGSIILYFFMLFVISKITSKNASNASFFQGDRNSKWYVVAFGMIGASLSGITFLSVPGWVITSQFSYMQMVLGYGLGYVIVAYLLLPIYYRLKLISIYSYLDGRFGKTSYLSGSYLFLISRIIGASFRLFLVAKVLQSMLLDDYGVPFFLTVTITILLIWLYTNNGGIKTVVWTDTLQTFFMILAVVIVIYSILQSMELDLDNMIQKIRTSNYSQTFFWENFKENKVHFFKHFISGAFITIVMTGLDQDMMQKNLTCKSVKESRRNVLSYGLVLVPINLMFLALGAILVFYMDHLQLPLPVKTDDLFLDVIKHGGLGIGVTIIFMIGLMAAAYSSADSALTSLTTSVTMDIFNGKSLNQYDLTLLRKRVHIGVSVVLLAVIMIYHWILSENVISALLKAAGYTYGPLLGLFAMGIFTSWKLKDKWVPLVCIIAPILSYWIQLKTPVWFNYTMSFELLLLNGLITFLGLAIIKKPSEVPRTGTKEGPTMKTT